MNSNSKCNQRKKDKNNKKFKKLNKKKLNRKIWSMKILLNSFHF